MITKRIAVALGALIALGQPALATPVDDYLDVQTAVEVNRLCGGFKSVEHRALLEIAAERRDLTDWFETTADAEAYRAVIEEHNAIARQRAADLDCGEQAQALLLSYLEDSMARVFGDLFLAFHFASLPPDSPDYIAMTPDEVDAAQRYDFYLQQRFGGNFPGFAAQVRDQVATEVANASVTQEPFNPLGAYLGGDLTGMSPGFGAQPNWVMMGLQGRAQMTTYRVLLEVATEISGRQLIERGRQGTAYIDVVDPATGAIDMKIWWGPSTAHLSDYSDSYLLALTDEGALRFVTWSQTAASQLGAAGTVALYVNTAPMPQDSASPSQYYQAESWLDAAERFTAAPTQACLGQGVCYEFSPADVEKMLQISSTPLVELVISPRADVGSFPRSESGFRYGSLDIAPLVALYEAWPPAP